MEEQSKNLTIEEQEEELNKERFSIFPSKVANALENIEKVFGVYFDVDDEIVERNRGGWAYAKGKGLHYSYCTSSYEDGPGYDYTKEFGFMLQALGFKQIGSHGDNGMDYTTNWRDTYWSYDYIYKPSETELMDDKEVDRLSQPLYNGYEY